jgi:hypothetical protein
VVGLVVEGRVITVDAWLTHCTVAEHVVHGSDAVMRGKGNQPQLSHDSQLVFQEGHVLAESLVIGETVDSGHGCREPCR